MIEGGASGMSQHKMTKSSGSGCGVNYPLAGRSSLLLSGEISHVSGELTEREAILSERMGEVSRGRSNQKPGVMPGTR